MPPIRGRTPERTYSSGYAIRQRSSTCQARKGIQDRSGPVSWAHVGQDSAPPAEHLVLGLLSSLDSGTQRGGLSLSYRQAVKLKGLLFKLGDLMTVKIYTDFNSNIAGSVRDRQSTVSHCTLIGGNLAMSSIRSEFQCQTGSVRQNGLRVSWKT